MRSAITKSTVLMLLTNAYEPDPRVRNEALTLIGAGCKVRLLAWDRDLKSPRRELMEGVEVERVYVASHHGRGNAQLLFYSWLYVKLLWRACKTQFDAVHCHDLDTLPIGFLLGKLKRKPVIYDAHESFPDMLQGSVHPVVRRGLIHLENFLIRRVNLLITVGDKLQRHFADRGARHSVVVGNWKRLSDYRLSNEQILQTRRRLGIPDDALTVVCITHLLKDRKIEELLQAIDELASVHLIVGGKGALAETVAARSAENPRVHYIGFVPAAEIPTYTCAADVVYYGFDPSNPNAQFSAPNKLYEALAAGKPIITGDFGEIGEIVRRAACGLILPEYSAAEIRNALTQLEDPETRKTMAGKAAQFGCAFMNWDRAEEILCREYDMVLRGALSCAQRGEGGAQAVEA